MSVEKELLLRILDGTAAPEQIRRVEDAIDTSPRIRCRLAELAEEKVARELRLRSATSRARPSPPDRVRRKGPAPESDPG